MNVSMTASRINSAMIGVYNTMFLGMLVTALVALGVSMNHDLMQAIFTTWLKWPVMLLPLVLVFVLSAGSLGNMTTSTMRTLFYVYAAATGLSLSVLVVVYTGGSIVLAFFMAAALFGTMSIYGYFTKRSLQSWGQYLFVGLIVLIIAMIINLFIGSSMMTMLLSAIAVLLFTALTAYDTQQIREILMKNSDGDGQQRATIMGALTLYLDFLNLFVNLLQLFGVKK